MKITRQEQEKDFDPNKNYASPGVMINKPCRVWAENGIEPGDFLGATSITKAVDSYEKFMVATGAPPGTELLLVRNNKRFKVVLGKGIVERED